MKARVLEQLLNHLGLRVIEVKDRSHNHFIARSVNPDEYGLYLVIVTNRVLNNPKANGIPYSGKMFGIRKSYVDYELIHAVKYVIWIYNGDAYIARSEDIRKFVYNAFPGITTCIKKRYEVICHYPVSLCKKVTPNLGLSKFLEVVRYAGH